MENIDLNEEKYIKEKIIINIIWANIFGIIILIIAIIIFGVPFFILSKNNIINYSLAVSEYNVWITLLINLSFIFVIIIIGIILHELIHGIFFVIFSKNKFKSIKFGILPKEKLFTPYCHCKEILKINHFKIALMMPLIILGILPAGISLIIGIYQILIFGILFITAGSGDLLMFIKLLREKNNSLIYDLPDDAGFIIYRQKI